MAKMILNKTNAGGVTISNFNLCYRLTVMKRQGTGPKADIEDINPASATLFLRKTPKMHIG